MIKKLRIKFIATAMASLFIVLAVIVGTVNIFNYRSIVDEADSILSLLEANEGKFPARQENPIGQRGKAPPEYEMRASSPELPYESRFFSVVITEDGQALSHDMANIAAISEEEAVDMAKRVISLEENSGFEKNYRYVIADLAEGKRVIFLDCTRDLDTFRTFMTASCIISLAGFIMVLILMVLLSARIVRPISESYERQKRFVTDAGHEIKTPLTIIDADAEVLGAELRDNEWLQDIQRQTRRLASLTNDLIYLSRMDEQQTKLKMIEFPVSDMAEETAQSFRSLAKMQKKHFAVDIEPMLTVKGDEGAVRQLLCILLDNALKYSPEGGAVSLVLRSKGRSVCIEVSNTVDEVSGDPGEFFERFYRADKSRNSDTGGFGIGLSIARAIAEAHKGKISAEYLDGPKLNIKATI